MRFLSAQCTTTNFSSFSFSLYFIAILFLGPEWHLSLVPIEAPQLGVGPMRLIPLVDPDRFEFKAGWLFSHAVGQHGSPICWFRWPSWSFRLVSFHTSHCFRDWRRLMRPVAAVGHPQYLIKSSSWWWMHCAGTVVYMIRISTPTAKSSDSDFVFSDTSGFTFAQRSAAILGLFRHFF